MLIVQSVHITTDVVSVNPTQEKVYMYTIMLYTLLVTCDTSMGFSPGTPVSSTDITEILLKVVLNTIILALNKT
jgi:hypothetical protein